ncbi:uncharacterized protein Z518_05753 [Rhinocladiella mackenziei CBS 650.93]|uniref:Cupin type-2 domain-containing protein n=1 Tax=Rhinocladiella mackenziei CBS 650.93 TaxID=1442369 RepID=A0A0D2FRU0_9EURO|nr:uncharacterized protein Z518_05753 [Rhinocladiella mackenziei CBS 650.93]KIX04882.1 hypothetical protein Z518_05753 [Rhinocladiella mackenziei CBS 650.93]
MSIPLVQEPLGRPAPYIVRQHEGEKMVIPGSKSVIRILASAKETDQLMSVFHMDGTTGDPAGFHYHNEAHDIFMCTKGQMKLWVEDKCRILSAGDFASVPPKVVHCPQLIGPINETVGLVTPGQWVDFFRFISEDYNGVFNDEFDHRNPMATLFPKLQEVKEKNNVVFTPNHVPAAVGEWTSDDSKLPSGVETYFLRTNTGGLFAVSSIESSSKFPASLLQRPFRFSKVHQVSHVLDGPLSIHLGGKSNLVHAGETVFLPAGITMAIEFKDVYVRFWSFASGNGLETLVSQAGREFEGFSVPDRPEEVKDDLAAEAARDIGMEFGI